ncbi:hypothetical protein HanRHA438_Chr13g0611681 [Helianthus annuus]|uniref:Uncharacterized protein n=1 Tax=Helianthus annuus TaxID=4232 RepID=A0A251SUL6_HELAN|nr:hypothetical protein HanXRQr2_Chr13g0601211 [Helianthus annuus]KAJ0477849.1 hypothetical protein HanHA300_Chr13g0493271 [Helianthus annuus]KAJ0482442.1 hypothetical protein HanIR_Chr13g0653941 [Helianthus annuus]KAJ0498677.1 hypothetical protein HanHA89_Chr13g0525361 [Helianthus annuus]KAJ0664691.1 hypothetical protein HanLR1_Chr13g0495361 [Helianthus annuus]
MLNACSLCQGHNDFITCSCLLIRWSPSSVHKRQILSYHSIGIDLSLCVHSYPFATFVDSFFGLEVFVFNIQIENLCMNLAYC